MKALFNSPNSAMAQALGKSLSAMGIDVMWRNQHYWRGEVEPCDVLVTGGFRRFPIIDAYKAKLPDLPVVCIDWGYFDRVNSKDQANQGHWMLAHGEINTLPIGKYPSDRLDATGVKFVANGGDTEGYVLIIGQVPTDTAVRDIDFSAWVQEQAAHHSEVLFRPHPRSPFRPKGVQTQMRGSLQQAFDGARLVVTYNSNAGWQALAAGLPVICDPCAAYAPLSGEKVASIAKRRELFSRAAYGQWKVSEADQAAKFLIERLIK